MRLTVLDLAGFRLGIQMRRDPPDDFDGPHAVSDRHDRIAIDALARAHSRHSRSTARVESAQNSIQIKENG